MANPRIDDEVKKKRGTYRKDSAAPGKDEETKGRLPYRPPEFAGYALEFWYLHVKHLWKSGWLTMDSVDAYKMVCKLYSDWKTLEEYLENPDVGYYYELKQPSGEYKPFERPEATRYYKLGETLKKWFMDMGIASTVKKVEKVEKKEKKPSGPPTLLEFVAGDK